MYKDICVQCSCDVCVQDLCNSCDVCVLDNATQCDVCVQLLDVCVRICWCSRTSNNRPLGVRYNYNYVLGSSYLHIMCAI